MKRFTPRRSTLLALLLLLAAALFTLAGCKAVQGFGRDIQSAAHEGQNWIDGKD